MDERRRARLARLAAIVDDLQEQKWNQICCRVPELMPLVDPISSVAANTRSPPLDRFRLCVRRVLRLVRAEVTEAYYTLVGWRFRLRVRRVLRWVRAKRAR